MNTISVKRILSILLCAVFLVSIIQQWIPKASAAVYSGECGPNLTWELDTSTGCLVISGSGQMNHYYIEDDNPSPWYRYRKTIKTVSLPDGLVTIGCGAFSGCTNLTSITIPDTVTDLFSCSFQECSKLDSIIIPDSVTSIGAYAFSCCTALQSVTIGKGVNWIDGHAFEECRSLSTVNISDLSAWCRIDFYIDEPDENSSPNFNEDSNPLFWAEELLLNGDPLTELIIPEGITTIKNYTFFNCKSLTRVVIPDGVTSIGEEAFNSCSNVTEAVISDTVEHIGYAAFACCEKLSTLQLGNGVISIGENAFESCISLTEVNIPNNVTDIGPGAFASCANLVSIRVPDSVTYLGAVAFGSCSSLKEVSLSNNLYILEHSLFAGCQSLTDVSIPNSVLCIEYDVFYNCTSLEDIYYSGSVEEWADIEIDEPVTELSQAHIHYNTASPEGHWTYTETAPTCTEAGETAFFCACGYSKNVVEVPALGHDWGEWTEITPPTCVEEGTKERICLRCQEMDNGVISALGHDYQNGFCTRCGEMDPSLENPFVDVKEGKYYYTPVLCAYYHDPQITNGTDATHFSPNKDCTREQIVTFLWKAAGAPDPETTENPFTDVKETKYYYKAVLWAVENGITNGVTADKFGVGQPCKREQAVTFLWKAAGAPEPETTENPFTDVKENKYYYKAILWAVENEITNGVSADKFGVGKTCTRGQIVTFLYKFMEG